MTFDVTAPAGYRILTVKLSRPSGPSGSYTGLIGFNPRSLKGPRGGAVRARDLFTVINLLVVTCQHALAHRARYCFTISVCLSVCLSVTLWYCITSFWHIWQFLNLTTSLQNSKRTHQRALNARGVYEKLCEFRQKSPFISKAAREPIVDYYKS